MSTELQASHTPGPWRWEVNLKSRVISLRGGSRPLYDWTVMDFVRWGMGNAQPRFLVDGLLCKAEEFAHVDPQREHHKAWFQLLSHPDANLIAAAPDLLEALKLLWRETELSGNSTAKDYGWPKAREATLAAIAKAEGNAT
jgi:hypothetical protein